MVYIKKIINGLLFSFSGFRFAMQEKAMQLELVGALIAIPTVLWVDKSVVEKVLLIFAVFLIFITELLNSAVERVTDRISLSKHNLSKQAKDIASCAVLFAVINAALVWGIIFWQDFIQFLYVILKL